MHGPGAPTTNTLQQAAGFLEHGIDMPPLSGYQKTIAQWTPEWP